jgi:hypothetical protein
MFLGNANEEREKVGSLAALGMTNQKNNDKPLCRGDIFLLNPQSHRLPNPSRKVARNPSPQPAFI